MARALLVLSIERLVAVTTRRPGKEVAWAVGHSPQLAFPDDLIRITCPNSRLPPIGIEYVADALARNYPGTSEPRKPYSLKKVNDSMARSTRLVSTILFEVDSGPLVGRTAWKTPIIFPVR